MYLFVLQVYHSFDRLNWKERNIDWDREGEERLKDRQTNRKRKKERERERHTKKREVYHSFDSLVRK